MENNFFSPPPLGEEIIIRDKSRIYSKRVLWRNNETSRIRIEKKKNLDDEDFNLQISQLFRFDFPDESNKRKKEEKKSCARRLMKRLPTVALESSNECSNYQR